MLPPSFINVCGLLPHSIFRRCHIAGEADFSKPYPLAPNSPGFGPSSYSTCLSTLISNWRQRYGANVPFIAGTFSFSQQGWWADWYEDFLRLNFGRGAYGPLSSGYYSITDASLIPVLGLSNLGLADAEYVVSPATRALTPSVVPYDPATTIHFSVLGQQMMGSRYFAAFVAVVTNSQPPAYAVAAPARPRFQFAAGASGFPPSMPFATLVFSHRVTPNQVIQSEYFLDSGASATYLPDGYDPNNPHKFSILYNLSQYARYDGQFEFYYVADVTDGSNPINAAGTNFQHWVQSANPLKSFNSPGTYTRIVDNYAGGYTLWEGLALDNTRLNNPDGGCAYIHDAGCYDNEQSVFFAIGQNGYCPDVRARWGG